MNVQQLGSYAVIKTGSDAGQAVYGVAGQDLFEMFVHIGSPGDAHRFTGAELQRGYADVCIIIISGLFKCKMQIEASVLRRLE